MKITPNSEKALSLNAGYQDKKMAKGFNLGIGKSFETKDGRFRAGVKNIGAILGNGEKAKFNAEGFVRVNEPYMSLGKLNYRPFLEGRLNYTYGETEKLPNEKLEKIVQIGMDTKIGGNKLSVSAGPVVSGDKFETSAEIQMEKKVPFGNIFAKTTMYIFEPAEFQAGIRIPLSK